LEFYQAEGSTTALKRLQVALAFDVEAAQDIIENLRMVLNSDPRAPRIRFVVIDTITPLLSPLLNAISAQGHAIMASFMQQLRSLAQTFSLVVFVINDNTFCNPSNPDSAFLTTNRKPALGPSFPFLSDSTLWLSKYSDNIANVSGTDKFTTHIAEVFRSKSERSRTWCTFKIQNGIMLDL
jgi:RAD51-like protein 3